MKYKLFVFFYNVFTVTFDQINGPLLNKTINFLKKIKKTVLDQICEALSFLYVRKHTWSNCTARFSGMIFWVSIQKRFPTCLLRGLAGKHVDLRLNYCYMESNIFIIHKHNRILQACITSHTDLSNPPQRIKLASDWQSQANLFLEK